MKNHRLSIVTPAYNESANLPLFHAELERALANTKTPWEWIIVDDHSTDRTFSVAKELAILDERVRAVRLARNSGSHLAALCGLHQAHGTALVVMAADLQDPPAVLPQMLEKWQAGAQTVWAVREEREGLSFFDKLFSNAFYWVFRNFFGQSHVPGTGADFFLIDRVVAESLLTVRETPMNLFALVSWMGFRQATIGYTKVARKNGVSGWTLKKKITLAIDSVTGFSHLPLRAMVYCGAGIAALGMAYSVSVILNRIYGNPASGWSSLMVVVLVLGGGQMLMLGVLGEYLWRALRQAQVRPLYMIEDSTGNSSLAQSSQGRTG